MRQTKIPHTCIWIDVSILENLYFHCCILQNTNMYWPIRVPFHNRKLLKRYTCVYTVLLSTPTIKCILREEKKQLLPKVNSGGHCKKCRLRLHVCTIIAFTTIKISFWSYHMYFVSTLGNFKSESDFVIILPCIIPLVTSFVNRFG